MSVSDILSSRNASVPVLCDFRGRAWIRNTNWSEKKRWVLITTVSQPMKKCENKNASSPSREPKTKFKKAISLCTFEIRMKMFRGCMLRLKLWNFVTNKRVVSFEYSIWNHSPRWKSLWYDISLVARLSRVEESLKRHYVLSYITRNTFLGSNPIVSSYVPRPLQKSKRCLFESPLKREVRRVTHKIHEQMKHFKSHLLDLHAQ